MRRAASSWVAVSVAAAGLAAACGGPRSTTPPRDAGVDAKPERGPVDAGVKLGPLERHPPPEIPTKKRLDATSSTLAFDRLRGGVWTANGDVGSVSYVDIDLGHQHIVQEIPVGKDIRSVALSPDYAWVAAVDRDGAQVSLIDPYTRQVSRSILTGTHPRAAVWDATNPRWLYVTLEDDDAVAIIDRTLGILTTTVPVGRLPAGIAVSRLRRELYVTHRVDPFVTTLVIGDESSPPSLTLDRNVVVPDQPADPTPTVPQGKPFAFEGMAWTSDGNYLWLPYELLAPTHPFVFNETLFPAISILDFTSGGGLEVQTNPNDPLGVIAGRKLLFAAINLPDAEGNTQIVSQPCAVATHPNGHVAYALACASEDLLVFDLTAGVAVQLLRNQPGSPLGDHPTGLAVDSKGQRAFVLSDQSHTISTLDLASGNLTDEVRLVAGPLQVVEKDTVDPEMRAGLKLFFNANSSRGQLATTGDDWMSCGGCHLDGFVSTNQRLFEMTFPNDPKKDAQIGHVGLTDLFSTVPAPTSKGLDPHDILVALTDQGGLAPDRTGHSRTGAVSPSSPTAEAKTMAAQIARVVARDLPFGPSWLLSPDGPPKESYDASWCGGCHAAQYSAWQQSAHAHAATDEMVTFCSGVEKGATGPEFPRLCAGCHDPVGTRLGEKSLTSGKGITCLACHDTVRTIRAGGNGDLQMDVHEWTKDHKAEASAGLGTLRTPAFCGGCHQQFVPGTGVAGIQTYDIWKSGPYGSAPVQTICLDCHMLVRSGVADHTFVGGNVYLAMKNGETELATREAMNLGSAFSLEAKKGTDGRVSVTVHNVGSGHDFPTGVTDIREPWVELQAVDGKGKALAHYGGPGADGLLPSGAARLGIDIAKADGTILLEHQLSLATRIPFDVRVPPKGSVVLTVTPPKSLPAGATGLDAVLLYHNVRTTYYRAASGDSKGSAPSVEMARAAVH